MKTFIFLLAYFFHLQAFAHEGKLLAVASDTGGFPADALCFFSNSQMNLSPTGLLIRYTCLGRDEIYNEMWQLGPDSTQLLAESGPGNYFTDPTVIDDKVYFFEFNEIRSEALVEVSNNRARKMNIPQEFKDSVLTGISKRGSQVIFRYTTSAGQNGEGQLIADTFSKLPNRDVDFYHIPAFSRSMTIQKLTLEKGEAIEVRLAPDFSPRRIIQSTSLNPSSLFSSFANYMVLNDDRWVVMAQTPAGPAAIIGEKDTFKVRLLGGLFQRIDFWPGAITKSGRYILRATRNGVNGLWLLQDEPILLIKAGDVIKAKDTELVTTKESLFYNSPLIDHNDQIYIGVGLALKENDPPLIQGIIEFPLP